MFSRKDRLPQYKKSLFKAQKMHKALDVQQRAAQNSPLHRFTASPLRVHCAQINNPAWPRTAGINPRTNNIGGVYE